MLRIRQSVLHLLLPCLLGATALNCVVVEDDDDNGDSLEDTGDGAEASGGANESGEDAQGRSVYACELRVVCQDGSITEVGQPLCLTPAEAAQEVALISEACTEDMTTVCEDIGDGSSLECGVECIDLEETCACEDPTRGCEV